MRDERIVWLPTVLHEHCLAEAERLSDLETGGAFMGYWHEDSAAVITAIIGPGPGALHERYSFEPDQQWQIDAIARHYEHSGRRETYLGDWHSHPGAPSGKLSWTDRRVLRRIIATPAARAPTPIMIVVHGNEGDWQATAWLAALKPRRVLWPKLLVTEATLRCYQAPRRLR